MRILKYLSIIAILLSVSCKKDDNTANTSELSYIPTFTGYTLTDDIGHPIGEVDITDWTFDSSWYPSEKALFDGYDSYNHNCGTVSGVSDFMAYPIPAKHIINFNIVKDSATQVIIRLVNQQFEHLISVDSLYDDDISFNIDEFQLSSGSIVRLYYVFINNEGCLYMGHGDILID